VPEVKRELENGNLNLTGVVKLAVHAKREKTPESKIVDLLSSCIKSVYTEDAIYEEYTQEELLEFVNSFSKSQFELIENFFLTMPKLVQHIEKDCEVCGAHNEMHLEGLQNFFV
jgi:hypothetical protein